MTASGADSGNTSLLRREMGLWDVVLFNIAAVLGPRWIARAAHAGESSLSLWVLAAIFFFVPTAFVIVELSSRYPNEGGLYVWTKEAFGDFHGFVAGWCYWIYTIIYFPGLLTASVAMSVYIGGPSYAWLAQNKLYIIAASILLLVIAAGLNLVGLNIGKWLQNAGGVATYVPLVMLLGVGAYVYFQSGSATAFSASAAAPSLDMNTLNFWSGIAFAFTGMELVCAMGEEVKDPRKTFPRSILISAIAIAFIYFLGTVAVLVILPADVVNTQNGVFQAISHVSSWIGIVAALLVTVGNAGGVGATIAGANRVPFAVGIDRYLPEAFGRLHPKWRTPYVAILVQVVLSAIILILANTNETISGAYEVLINATIIVYFVPFLYMYAAVIKLSTRADRGANPDAVLIPGGTAGVWIAGTLGFLVTALSIILAVIPSKDVTDALSYELKLVGGTLGAIAIGLALYWRGSRQRHGLSV
ncbi:MAG TPA: APC family permease [Terriglobales bacterium]|nr:APC family permease [Terriglobales bacterium]